jgi:hypothetical protein
LDLASAIAANGVPRAAMRRHTRKATAPQSSEEERKGFSVLEFWRVCVIKLPKGFALEVKVKSQNARVVGDLNLSLFAPLRRGARSQASAESSARGPLSLASGALPLCSRWVPSSQKRP